MIGERSKEEVTITSWKKKAEYFKKGNLEVFVILNNGVWKTGHITDIGEECLLIDSYIEGVIPVFYMEIKDIAGRRKKE